MVAWIFQSSFDSGVRITLGALPFAASRQRNEDEERSHVIAHR